MIRLKRVYEPAAAADGLRLLVDRLWPRGLRKEEARLHDWLREVAPSGPLRKWFGHEPAKWAEFQRRYAAELRAKPEIWQPIVDAARHGTVTLLFSARDAENNNAAALKFFLEQPPGPARVARSARRITRKSQ
jgi:uncharacterized protein YeaO (DUF488 family)